MFSNSPDFSLLFEKQDPQARHRLLVKDKESMTGVCSVCGPVHLVLARNRGHSKYVTCGNRRNAYRRHSYYRSEDRYREHLKSACERCGFVPVDTCQMDIHHKDGNHQNNLPQNLETVCCLCHRLITKNQNELRRIAKQIASALRYRFTIYN